MEGAKYTSLIDLILWITHPKANMEPEKGTLENMNNNMELN